MNDNLDAAVALMDGAPELINEPMTSELFQGSRTHKLAQTQKRAQTHVMQFKFYRPGSQVEATVSRAATKKIKNLRDREKILMEEMKTSKMDVWCIFVPQNYKVYFKMNKYLMCIVAFKIYDGLHTC